SGVVFAWVDAFLLPDAAGDFGVDLQTAMNQAKAANKPVFIDFTGEQCTNCRYNENNVFTKPQVWALMEQYERVRIDAQYGVPKEAYIEVPSDRDRQRESDINAEFRSSKFGTEQLPLYVLLLPQKDGRWQARVYEEGKINDVEGFKKYLLSGLAEKK